MRQVNLVKTEQVDVAWMTTSFKHTHVFELKARLHCTSSYRGKGTGVLMQQLNVRPSLFHTDPIECLCCIRHVNFKINRA